MNKNKSKNKIIAELKKEISHLKKLVVQDELTSALNRTGFKKEVADILKEVVFFKKTKRKKKNIHRKKFLARELSVLFIDVDGLKKINDLHGHSTGDRLIKKTAILIKENVRTTDFVGRWGGDEFVVAFPGSSEGDAYKISEKIRKSIKNKGKMLGLRKAKVSLSIGVVGVTKELLASSDSLTIDDLIDYADVAMYEAKRVRGGDNSVKYSEIS
ncbi:MAG: GGDEF domain-containing protein [Candidatus Paceibacterota bacterium]